jgi:hypothetical protein
MSFRKPLVTVLTAIVLGLAAATSIGAIDNPNRTSYLTFNRPVALPGATLVSGTYIFEMADPSGAPDVVRVLSRNRQIVYLTAFTRSVARPADGPHVTFGGEAAPDSPLPISVWWSEDLTGRQFIYTR